MRGGRIRRSDSKSGSHFPSGLHTAGAWTLRESPLHTVALRTGWSVDAVRAATVKALSSGVSVSATDASGDTCLHVAARRGAVPFLRLVCSGSFARRDDVVTALWLRCAKGRRPLDVAVAAAARRRADPGFVDVASVSVHDAAVRVLTAATRGSVVRLRALQARQALETQLREEWDSRLADAQGQAATAATVLAAAQQLHGRVKVEFEAARRTAERRAVNDAGQAAVAGRRAELLASEAGKATVAAETEKEEVRVREELRTRDAPVPPDVPGIARRQAMRKLVAKAKRRAEDAALTKFRRAHPPPAACSACRRAFMDTEGLEAHLAGSAKCRLKRAGSASSSSRLLRRGPSHR